MRVAGFAMAFCRLASFFASPKCTSAAILQIRGLDKPSGLLNKLSEASGPAIRAGANALAKISNFKSRPPQPDFYLPILMQPYS